jgi:TonB-linked SusC/RagA family outer membrane protein
MAITASAQQHIVKGMVTDAQTGNPFPGVNILVVGTSTGASTGSKGHYSVSVSSLQDTLRFSFIGYKTKKVAIDGQTTIDVALSPSIISGQQMVVVGFGTQKKKNLTGDISSADIKTFKESPNVNITQSLHGTIPGLVVGAVNHSGESPSIKIRGQNNFAGNNTPLIVVDGIIYKGNINDINPNNVKSVDILKGPSAEAIYGAQSSNGVILITTKKGKEGMKPILSYSGYYSIQQPSHLVRPASPQANIKSIKDSYWQSAFLPPGYTKPNPKFNVASFFKTTHIAQGYENFLKNGTYYNWWNSLTGKARTMNHNLSLMGGGKKSNYYISGGYINQNGYIYNDNYKRYSVRINYSSDVTKWLNLGINSFASRNNYSGASVDQSTLFTYTPFASPYDSSGNLITKPDGNRINPLLISEINDRNLEDHLFANIHADIKLPFLKGFDYRLNFGNDYQSERHYQFNPWASTNRGEGYKNYANYYDLTVDNIFTYKRDLNKNNNLNLTFVYGIGKRKENSTNVTAQDFHNKTLGYNALQLGNASLNAINTGAWVQSSLHMVGRLVYTFKNKYVFTGTIRRDGFSGFGKNNKFGIFPSGAVAWIISREKFIKDNVPWISSLKLRVGYGVTGRRGLKRYQTLAQVSTSYSYVFGGSSVIGQSISSLANPNLRWETTTGIDPGINFSLFNSRLSGSIDYYKNKTRNILYSVPLPHITGFGSADINVGKVVNHGLELELKGSIVRNHHLKWNAAVDYSMNRNKIITITGQGNLVAAGLFKGQPINLIYGYNNIGMWQLADQKAGKIPRGFFPGTYKVKDLNKDGKITTADREVLGYKEPAYSVGFGSTLDYKNFTFKIFLHTIQGGKHYYYSTADDPGGGTGDNWTNHNKPQLWNYWLPSNPNAKYRRLDKTSSYNQPLLAQRNFIRLQNVTIMYNLPSNLLKKWGINTLAIFASGKNLLTITKWKGWDPETGEGYNASGTPVLRSYTMGINFKF